MLILAIETSADLCGIAVCRDGEVVAERTYLHRMHLSERLVADTRAVLEDAGAALSSLDGLAVDIGPGSFTGIRVGVVTAKTWADALGKPLWGVSTLNALREPFRDMTDYTVVPVVRARPGTVYALLPQGAAQGELVPVAEIPGRLAPLGNATYLFCGDGLVRSGAALREGLLAAGLRAEFARPEAPRARDLARLAERRAAAGEVDDPMTLAPLYIAPPPIDPRVEQRIAAAQARR